MNSRIIVCTAAAMLFASSAMAGHCDADIADAYSAIDAATFADSNAIETATTLVEQAIDACDAEEDQIAAAEPGSPMTDPEYVSMGQSILLSAVQLVSE